MLCHYYFYGDYGAMVSIQNCGFWDFGSNPNNHPILFAPVEELENSLDLKSRVRMHSIGSTPIGGTIYMIVILCFRGIKIVP